MAIMGLGEYNTTAPTYTTGGQHGKMQVDRNGNLRVNSVAAVRETPVIKAGAGSTYGLIDAAGGVLNTAKLYVVCDCSAVGVSAVDWIVSSDAQFTYQFFRAAANPLKATLTLTDATAADADDTFILNGLTYTYKAGANVPATRFIGLGADNAAAAANTRLMLLDATYGLLGVSDVVATAPGGTDVLTITCTNTSTLNFAQGTSAANEVGYADLTLTNLYTQAAVSANVAATTGTNGYTYKQTVDGWPFAVLCYTNTSGGAAAAPVIRSIRY
jgi:hypothetical protein